MRTKTLLLTAALSAAGLATSLAQPVYSVNAVGYVNLTLPGNSKLSLIANPLNGSNNLVSTILPTLPDGNVGTQISFWDATTQNFDPCQIIFVPGLGWVDCNNNVSTNNLTPGAAFFIQVLGPDLNVTFVGEVPQGHLVNPLSTAPGSLSFISSIVPQRGIVDTELGLPATSPDHVATFNPNGGGIGSYNDSVIKLPDGTWAYGDGSVSTGPVIEVGQGFVFGNDSGMAPASWTRDFSVN